MLTKPTTTPIIPSISPARDKPLHVWPKPITPTMIAAAPNITAAILLQVAIARIPNTNAKIPSIKPISGVAGGAGVRAGFIVAVL